MKAELLVDTIRLNNDNTGDGTRMRGLTKGKIYEVEQSSGLSNEDMWHLLDDNGSSQTLFKRRFRIIGEEKFKVGDKVVATCTKPYDITCKGNGYGIVTRIMKVISDGDNNLEIDWFYPDGEESDEGPFDVESKYFEKYNKEIYEKTIEVIKMELKDIKQANLVEARKQFDLAKANEEVEFAKNEFRRVTDKINEFDRQIKSYEDAKKPYLEILAKFSSK